MIRHYLKIAFRNMQKQKMYAAINIGGFAIGIAACLLIALYIQNETSYDQDNPNKDRVYRITAEATVNGIKFSGISLPARLVNKDTEAAGAPGSSDYHFRQHEFQGHC